MTVDVLLCGLPRSGTTWAGKILDSHPDTLYLHEPDSVLRRPDLPFYPDPGDKAVAVPLGDYLDALGKVRAPRCLAKRPFFPKAWEPRAGYWWRQMQALGSKLLERAGLSPGIRLWMRPGSKPVVVCKSIEASGRLPLWARSRPGLRLVYLVRHPGGQLASLIRGLREGAMPAGFDPSEDRSALRSLAHRPWARERGHDEAAWEGMGPVERLALRWALVNDFVLESLEGLPNARVLRYEDLCADPEGGARELLAFAGLDWHGQTAAFLRRSTAGQGGYYEVRRDPRQAAWRWREELEPQEVEAVERVVAGSRGAAIYGL